MILERLLKGRSYANDRAVPESGRRCPPPVRMRCIENGFIPEESPVDATIGFRLSRVFTGDSAELLSDEMLRVPELTGALVRDSAERGVNR